MRGKREVIMLPLNRCIDLLSYNSTLSDTQRESIIYYLKKLRDKAEYSDNTSRIPLTGIYRRQ